MSEAAVRVFVGRDARRPAGPSVGEIIGRFERRGLTIAAMELVGEGDHPDWRRYQTEVSFPRAGNFGFTVRCVPAHPDIDDYAQLGRVALPQAGRWYPPHRQGLVLGLRGAKEACGRRLRSGPGRR